MLHIPSVRAASLDQRRISTKERVLSQVERLTGVRPDSSFISEQGTELCVCCGKDTGISVLKHVDEREYYVDGVGQHCDECY